MYTFYHSTGNRYGKYLSRLLLFFAFLGGGLDLIAQPTVAFFSGSATIRQNLAARGGARFARFQANSLSSTYAFHVGSVGTPDYNPCWRPYTGGDAAAGNFPGFNQLVTPASLNSARYNTFGGGVDGNLPATTSGNYYTLNIGNNGGADNNMSILETTYNPVSITSVSSPLVASVFQRQSVTVRATLSAPLNAGENCVIRWTNDGFASSNFIDMTLVSGSTYQGVIPGQTAAGTVQYYVLTTNSFGTISHANADFLTLNLRNSVGENVSGANFSYTVSGAAVRYTVNNGTWSTASIWDGGTTPAAGATCIINHNVTLNTSTTVSNLVVNNGATFQNADGTARTLTINTGAILVNEGTWTNNASSTFTFSGSGTIRGLNAIVLQNVNIAGGVDFGTLNSSGLTTINGTLQINTGGFVNTNGVFYGPSSTLAYTTNYTCGAEWYAGVSSGVGVPQNITANAAITITQTGSSFRRANGSFTTNNGSAVLTLSTSVGGDFEIGGDLLFNTINHNNRFITFLGSGIQTWNRQSAGDLTVPFVRISKSGGRVIVGANINTLTINGLAGSTLNCLETQSSTSILDINGRTLALGQRCSFVAGGGLYAGTPATASGNLNLINGNASTTGMTDWGTLRFVSTNPRLANFTVNVTGGSAPGVTLGTDMMASSTNLNGGTLKIGGFNFNTSTTAGGFSGSVGAVSVGSGGTLFLSSNGHTGTATFDDGSTVTHIANGNDNVRAGVSYYNLTFNGTGGTKTLANGATLATEVRNNLTIPSGVTLLVANRILNVTGSGTKLTGAGTITVGNASGAGFVTVSGNWGGPALTLQNNVNSVVRVDGNVTAAGTFNFNSLVGATFMLLGDWLVENAFSNNTNGGLIYLAGNNQAFRPERTATGASLLIHRLRLKGGTKTMGGLNSAGAGFNTFTVSDSINLMNGAILAFPTTNPVTRGTDLIINGRIGGPASGPNSPAGQVKGSPEGRVSIAGASAFSAGTLRFTSDLLGELNLTRSVANVEVCAIGTNLTVNAYTFANNTGFVTVNNSSTFTLTGNGSRPGTATAYTQANHQSGNGQTGAQRFFALSQGSKYVFSPSYSVLAGTQIPYPVGLDANDPNFATFFEGLADGTVSVSGTTVTGSSTFFNEQLAVGDQLISPSGTVIGTIATITSNLAATLTSSATYSGQFRIRKAYRPFQLGPVGSDVLSGYSMEVEFLNHTGGIVQTATNVPTSDGSRRTNYLFRLTPHLSHPALSLRHEVLVSNNSTDFNASMTYNQTAFYRYTGVWERVAANSRTPAILTPGARTVLIRNSVENPATNNTYIVGQTGGGLPNDPTYLWTGASNSSWTNPANWTPLGVPPATFPNSSTHNIIINGGANDVVIPSGTFSVNDIQHNAKTLTVSGNANLEVNGNYNLNFPSSSATAGLGTISSTGTATITGDGTSFTTQLAPGSYLYDAQTNLFYGIVQSITNNLTLTLANMANSSGGVSFSTIPLETGFNFITPPSSVLGSINVSATAGSRDLIANSGNFTSTMLGRVVLEDGTGAYIGVIAGIVNPTTARMAAEAPANYTGNLVLRAAINPIGTGALLCQPGSFVNYGSSGYQNIALASYAKLGFRDSRPNNLGVGSVQGLNRYLIPTGRTIIITDTFITRAGVKAIPITGTQFQFTETSTYKAILPAFNNGGSPLSLGAAPTFRSYDPFNGHPAIVWGPSPTALIDMVFDNRNNNTGAYNFQGPDAQALVEGKVRNFTIISRGSNTITTPNGFNMTVKGTFELQKPGPAARALQLGNAATPNCTVTFLGPIVNGQYIGRGAGQLANFNILGTGSISGGDIFDAFYSGSGSTPSIQSLTINRSGASIVLANSVSSQHLVAAGDINIANGTLSRPAGGDINAQGNMVISGTGSILHGGTGGVSASLPTSNLIMTGDASISHTGTGGVGSVGNATLSNNASWNLSANTGTGFIHGTAGSLTISNGASISLPASADFICLGDFTQNGGTFSKPGGTLNFQGNIAFNGGIRNTSNANLAFGPVTLPGPIVVPAGNPQSLSSTNNLAFPINNWTINKSAGSVIVASGSLRLGGVLTISSATSVTANTGNVTLVSTPSQTGSIAALTSGSIAGNNWTMQRYLTGSTSHWSFLGTPVIGASVGQMSDDWQVTLPSSVTEATYLMDNSERATIFTHEEDQNGVHVDTVQRRGWRVLTTNAISVGKGYRTFLRSSWLDANRIWDVTGPLQSGNVTLSPLTKTAYSCAGQPVVRCSVTDQGYNLIANPYPSAIDWNLVSKTNVNNAAYRWVETSPGVYGYRAYLPGFPAPDINGVTGVANEPIPSSQGFFVYVTGAAPTTGSVTFSETNKVSGSGTFHRVASEKVNQLGIIVKGQGQLDWAAVRFRPDATGEFDMNLDAHKMGNPVLNISTPTTDGISMVFNSLGMFTESTSVPVEIRSEIPGNYHLEFKDVNTFDLGTELYLKDNYLGELTPITEGLEYLFSINSDAASQGADRFEIVFAPQAVTATKKDILEFAASIVPNPSNGQGISIFLKNPSVATTRILITDMLGKVVLDEDFATSRNQIKLDANLSMGVYQVLVSNGGNTSLHKIVVNK